MFTPITRGIWRWAVPDPEDHWLMVGHLMEDVDGVVLVDPPMHPDLPKWLHRMGGVGAIVLTTHDHTRGARYLSRAFQCPIYIPHQASPEAIRRAGITDPVPYDETTRLPVGLRPLRCRVRLPMWESQRPYLDEMMLIYKTHTVIVGDVVMGDDKGRLQACPEGFNDPADLVKVRASLTAFTETLPSQVDILLASHGTDLLKDLRTQMKYRDSMLPRSSR